MARPLTRVTKDGRFYTRLPSVEHAIDRLLLLDFESVLRKAGVDDPKSQDYVPSECLVHLLRSTRFDNDDSRFQRLFEVLVARIERGLRGSVRSSRLYDAGELRTEVVDRFVDLLVDDRSTPGTKLDFFEVRFASSMAALRVDVMRKSRRAAADTDHVEDLQYAGDGALPALTAFIRQAYVADGPEQEKEHFRNDLLRAIDSLPAHQREAVALFLEGLRTEGGDVETIAKLCGVSDRAVRYRLANAFETLRQQLGD